MSSGREWSWMHALGREGLPEAVTCAGRSWRLARFIKHDFFAATGFYEDEAGRMAVIKFGRSRRLLGVPMGWAGRWLTRRETRFYDRLAEMEGVPGWLGYVDPPHIGFAHEFVPGTTLGDVAIGRVPDGFFRDLWRLLEAMHERGIAYVDLDKPWNILLGDDGRAWLIDFQISFDAGDRPGPLRRWLLRKFVRADRYHFLKHKKRHRPDLLREEERAEAEQRAWFIRLHRTLTRPYFVVRRRLFAHLRRTGRLLPEGSK